MKALVFDAYGTLFDPYSVGQGCEREFPGAGAAVAQAWRAKQLEYTWLRSLMARYEDFWKITLAALEYACRAQGLELSPETKARLMDEYLRLAPYPGAVETLSRLKQSGRRLLILSNGTPGMLSAVVENAGLAEVFEQVLSVHTVKIYKPSPAVYQLAATRTKLERGAIGFVSSNFWDISGATSFGFHTYWINRAGATPDGLGYAPEATVASLAELEHVVA